MTTNTVILGQSAEVAFQQATEAMSYLRKFLVDRPNKLVIGGKQYLEYRDWQFLGMHFGITPRVDHVEEINIIQDERLKFIGFKSTASAIRDDKVLSTAVMECTRQEPNWTNKPRFQICSMAETRACAKVLRNVLSWVFALPESEGIEHTASVEELNNGQEGLL